MSHPSLDDLLAHRRSPEPSVSTHLAGCPRCARVASEVEHGLQRLLEPELPDLEADLADSWIRAAVAAQEPPRERRWGWGWLAPGLSVAALLISLTALAVVLRSGAAGGPEAPPPLPPPPAVQVLPSPLPPPNTAPPVVPVPPATPRRRVGGPAAAPAPRPADAPDEAAAPTARPQTPDARTLFREASEALGRGEEEVARQLLLILLELQPGLDLQALVAAEEGWRLRLADPGRAAASFRACAALDATGALGADCAGWACEALPADCGSSDEARPR